MRAWLKTADMWAISQCLFLKRKVVCSSHDHSLESFVAALFEQERSLQLPRKKQGHALVCCQSRLPNYWPNEMRICGFKLPARSQRQLVDRVAQPAIFCVSNTSLAKGSAHIWPMRVDELQQFIANKPINCKTAVWYQNWFPPFKKIWNAAVCTLMSAWLRTVSSNAFITYVLRAIYSPALPSCKHFWKVLLTHLNTRCPCCLHCVILRKSSAGFRNISHVCRLVRSQFRAQPSIRGISGRNSSCCTWSVALWQHQRAISQQISAFCCSGTVQLVATGTQQSFSCSDADRKITKNSILQFLWISWSRKTQQLRRKTVKGSVFAALKIVPLMSTTKSRSCCLSLVHYVCSFPFPSTWFHVNWYNILIFATYLFTCREICYVDQRNIESC